jgi:ElaB/YqjD/DUF883 family membrane-anchored ribosome-binding protein
MAAQDTGTMTEEPRVNGSDDQDRRIREFAERAEQAVRARADEFRTRAREYYDDAYDRFDTAQRYLTERVQEKPVASTLAAVGVGVVLGLLIAGGRRR